MHAKSVWGSARERIRSSQIDRLLGQEPTDSRKQLHSTELWNAVHLKVEAVFLNLSLNLARSAVCYLGGFGRLGATVSSGIPSASVAPS